MAPEALPSGYRNWITNASKVSKPCLPVNLSASRTGTFDPAVARQTLDWGRGATGQNAALIEAYCQNAEKVRVLLQKVESVLDNVSNDEFVLYSGRFWNTFCTMLCRSPFPGYLHRNCYRSLASRLPVSLVPSAFQACITFHFNHILLSNQMDCSRLRGTSLNSRNHSSLQSLPQKVSVLLPHTSQYLVLEPDRPSSHPLHLQPFTSSPFSSDSLEITVLNQFSPELSSVPSEVLLSSLPS